MDTNDTIIRTPIIPDDAPFSQDQKAWISGFMAGMQSRIAMQEKQSTVAAKPLNILVGTQTGNAEMVAADAADFARKNGFGPIVQELDSIELDDLATMERVLVVTSTYGEGEMPDNAQIFWDALASGDAPRLEKTHYSVLALGDTGYDGFCEAGKLIDMRFEQLGARRIHNRVDCDVDYEAPAETWIGDVIPMIGEYGSQDVGVDHNAVASAPAPAKSKWNRKNPYPSNVAVNRLLSGKGSGKEIRHFEFALGDSGIEYTAGDALSVMPLNEPALADALMARLGLKDDTSVSGHDESLGDLLRKNLEIRTPSKDFLTALEERTGNEELTHLMRHGDKEAMDAYLWGKDTLDLLNLHPNASFDADGFVSLLKPLQHRAYSISSSALAHPDHIHLTIAAVRYHANERDHNGVCSTYLSDRLSDGDHVGIFAAPNKAFRVPENGDVPMIMVGPGTGVAPFRAFLQERAESGAKGMNWLFFGDQTRADDYIYEDEMTAFEKNGVLHKLDLAFSRDQAEKIYVQHRMKEKAKDLYAALEEGGHFYVCGDATRMAKDVDAMLHTVIAQEGGLDADAASDYVTRLKKEKRYLRDVY